MCQQGRWIVRSHIGWREEWSIPYKVWKPLPSIRVLKPLGKLRRESQRRQYLLAVGFYNSCCCWIRIKERKGENVVLNFHISYRLHRSISDFNHSSTLAGPRLLRDWSRHSSFQLHIEKGTWIISRTFKKWNTWSRSNHPGIYLAPLHSFFFLF